MKRATALAIVLIFAACSESSRPPRSPVSPGTSTPQPFTTRLELTGPDTVYRGQAVQFTVTSHISDGTTRDVTKQVTWRSVNPAVLTMTEPGLFTGKGHGQTPISAAFGGLTASIGEVIVVPEGTYRLMGTVRDAGVPVDATVEIESQALGRVKLQTTGGQYVVYGVAGNTEVEVERTGYEEERFTRVVAAHTRFDIDLRLSRPREVAEGDYRLTVTAGPECGSLPAAAQSRSYAARVQQSGPSLTVILDGAQFGTSSGRTLNRFNGFLEPDRAVFTLAPSYPYYYWYFYFPEVFEIVESGSYYSFDGRAVAATRTDGFEGTLDGSVTMFAGASYAITASCRSASHRFILRKTTS
jgi:hypothetical protein